jgi:signal transduction histidine kinase
VKRLSLRWKLILLSGSLALLTTIVVGTTLDLRAKEQLLEQLGKSLETKCDEVITVLEHPDPSPTIEEFLIIETSYRFTRHRYYYQIRDVSGGTLVRSTNIERVSLPLPAAWHHGEPARAVVVETVPSPTPPYDDPLLVRSERVDVNLHGRNRKTLIIQTAVSLGQWKAGVWDEFVNDGIDAALILAGVFVLIWFVTTMSFRPVAAMTRKAAQISATSLRDRIPISGRADELDELATVLNRMLDRLADSMRQIAEFSADAAHQLRTPLTSIRGKLDLMLRGELAEPLRREVEKLQEEVIRLSRLCGRLLLLGRLELNTGEANLLEESVDLKEVAEELVEQCAPMAHERGITLELGQAAIVCVRGSRILLVEAVLNLIDNAIRWSPRAGTVRVWVTGDGQEVSLSVADNGPGVPEQERAHIFRAFYRIKKDSGSHTSEGFGLGLAIVHAIARAHGGRVELICSAGTGCEFRLVFPLHSVI